MKPIFVLEYMYDYTNTTENFKINDNVQDRDRQI